MWGHPRGRNQVRHAPRNTARGASARLRFEFLESRLLMSWGDVPPATVAVPRKAVAIALDSQDDAQGSASINRKEVDFYTFVTPRDGTYRFSTQTPNSALDTVIAVFDSAGRRVAFNDDIVFAANTDSDLTVTLPGGSRFYFGVTNYRGTRGGSYTWLVDGPGGGGVADDSFEENDSLAQASDLGTLSVPRTIAGLVMADSQDWFKFELPGAGGSSSLVSIEFQHSQGDLDLRLCDSAGTQLRISDGVTDSELIALDGLPAGTYYVQAYGYHGVTNPNYSLIVDPGSGSATPIGGFHIDVTFSGLTASQRIIFADAAARWEQVITGDLPNAQFNGMTVDDLLIDASATPIDGVNGILGEAGPDRFRNGTLLPYHGTMQFDSADLSGMESDGTLRDVILHEMGHVLGVGTIWENLGLVSGAGGSNPSFTGANATAEYNAIFGRSSSGVPLENSGGAGTRDSHWRESVFQNELMTGWISAAGTPNPLSRVTVGSLRDLGYSVEMAAADAFLPSGSSVVAASASGQSTQAQLNATIEPVVWHESFVSNDATTHAATSELPDPVPVDRESHLHRATPQASLVVEQTPLDWPADRHRADAIDDVLAGGDLRGLDLASSFIGTA